jgi:SAM-dependent methyltransferase
MNTSFWNELYANDRYAYGKEPNDFLSTAALKPNSKVLCLAEGEGRNAVFLASHGHSVTMIDYSASGIAKAEALAKANNVHIDTICADLSNYQIQTDSWDCIVVIFGHFPPTVRKFIYEQIPTALKMGGLFVSETYSIDQIKFGTGGPKNPEMMPTVDELSTYLTDFRQVEINQLERNIHEGELHNGNSSVIQVIAIR